MEDWRPAVVNHDAWLRPVPHETSAVVRLAGSAAREDVEVGLGRGAVGYRQQPVEIGGRDPAPRGGQGLTVSDASESRLCEEGLVFFGRVMAGQCHELVNVFNVVNELSGLQEDILDRVRQGVAGSLERVGDLACRIQAQVKRGQTIIRNLHQFAHSVDAPWVVFDAREVVGRVVFFAARQTRLRQTELTDHLPDESVALESNPFWLQQAVYLGIELLLEGTAERRRISVTLSPRTDGAAIELVSADPAPRGAAADGRLLAIAGMLQVLGGEVLEAPRHAVDDRLVLFVPHSRRGDARPEARVAGVAGAGGGR